MAAVITRLLLAALALLSLATPASVVEVCKVVDLQLVTQTGEFFLAGTAMLPPTSSHRADTLGCTQLTLLDFVGSVSCQSRVSGKLRSER